MASREEISLFSHLMRRAGFGENRRNIEALAEQNYEDVVESLIEPGDEPRVDEYRMYRYHPINARYPKEAHWLYYMVNSTRQLEEKVTLFWHHVFATGTVKAGEYEMATQIELFRKLGMGSYKNILVAIAKSPAMIYWLDNNENHKREPNENWGRELLELFSLGVGHYSEDDVKACARAFTGWTANIKLRGTAWGPVPSIFEYKPEDHDDGEKTFLGKTGQFNGEDIINIILDQPATSNFIARHLYNFFVADEPQVPAWPFKNPSDPDAVEILAQTLVENDYEIKPVLRILFNSSFFKEALYQKVRSPAEVVANTLRFVDDMRGPDPRWGEMPLETGYMGQILMDPPSVEGWHTGKEWINSGAFINRVNFVADRIKDITLPGIQDVIRRISESNGSAMSPSELVDQCLDMMGPLTVDPETHDELLEQAEYSAPISWSSKEEYAASSRLVSDIMALIAGTREYQMG